MAMRKLDVVGLMEVGGVRHGVVELDDEVINVDALLVGGLVKEHVDPPKTEKKKKGSNHTGLFEEEGD